ncbi:metal-dependent hydrolase [Cohnella endophytica]|uniref:Metal-dependent hydrolase n=1 Tax=Cohnella endophytica TaxID=2419778 RepID=A0A494Y5Y1_9BACL|nr:metal-dependent hydrolase [Cohnella endophytica]RKP56925.1 metal-dependent hydrolase [Cohnella endophytica]
MDTGSHLLFGATLAGLAFVFPAVSSDPQLAAAALTVSLVGSHAPDLDSVTRLFGNDVYLKLHRSYSHSVAAWPLWAVAIGSLAAWAWGAGEHWALLCGVALAAVVLHVAFDYTNAYGVQSLLPFNKEWHHLDALVLTDPFLVFIHAGAVMISLSNGLADPALPCGVAWAVSIVYIGWRALHHRLIVRRIRRRFRRWRAVHVLPGLWWYRWQYVVQTDTGHEMGEISGRRILPSESLPFGESHACIEATRNASSVRTLLGYAKRQHASWTSLPGGGYRVTWTDLRFWRPGKLPYRAEVWLDDQFNVRRECIGWHKKAWEAPYV